jgi:imidazolonepropionase-like amidohydrolase
MQVVACGGDSTGLALRGVTMIDGTGASPAPDRTLLIRDDRIVRVGAEREISVPPGFEVVDGRGRFAIPGLWDFHVHLSKTGPSALATCVAHGVTSVRDAGGDLEEIHAWRDDVRAWRRVGPSILTAGPLLESPESVERATASGSTENFSRTRVVIGGPEEVEAALASLRDRGVDFLKIRTFADPETYFSIAAAARRLGLPLMGHPPWEIDPVEAARAGQATFEHGFYPYPLDDLEAGRQEALTRVLVESSVAYVPTLVAWQSQTVSGKRLREIVEDRNAEIEPRRRWVSDRLLENWMEYVIEREGEDVRTADDLASWSTAIDRMAADLGRLHAAGVPILAGTDVAAPLVYPGFSLHDELELLVEKVGLSPAEVVELATSGAARAMGVEADRGSLAAGRRADLVLLAADPTVDIRATRLIVGVVLGGRYLDRQALDDLLEQGAS